MYFLQAISSFIENSTLFCNVIYDNLEKYINYFELKIGYLFIAYYLLSNLYIRISAFQGEIYGCEIVLRGFLIE